MAGHSKWANIKHKKAKTDAIKGKLFAKMAREIIVATRAGGPDPNNNFRLKIAIDNAKAANLPNDNIQRAIQKGSGEGDEANFEELRYEGYGPGGVAIMADILTDNRNRTASETRHIFSKNGGNLGETGSVSWMFTEKGQLTVPKEELKVSEDDLMLLALEAGAEDIEEQDESFEIYTEPAALQDVRQALLDGGIPIENAEVNLIPGNRVEVSDLEQAKKVINLIDALENHDDVQKVYTNFELAESLSEEEF
ncbi:MAG: YebC/PmpR family DNA-binding transcriptional regulator [Peptococcaceae bacterium]|jgi:YebC/PmpR family DNA-binding regulatory protein|nr:YebC/PmpR family DNA-binding transcriptional regulator [Peptococcaceae bacterium]